MKRLDYDVAIKEAVVELQALYGKQSRSLARRRLRFLLLLKNGQCTSQAQAGAKIGIQQRAAEKLWALYRTAGLEALLEKPHSGKPAKLNQKVKEALQRELDKDNIQTLKQACEFVWHHRQVSISGATMHYYFKAQGIKKKTGRPRNVKKDLAGEEQFKKSLSAPEEALWQEHLLRR
jgi:transposase